MSISNLVSTASNEIRARLIEGEQINSDEIDTQDLSVAGSLTAAGELQVNEIKISPKVESLVGFANTDIIVPSYSGQIIINMPGAVPAAGETAEYTLQNAGIDTDNNICAWLGGGSGANALLTNDQADAMLSALAICCRQTTDGEAKIRIQNTGSVNYPEDKIVISWLII